MFKTLPLALLLTLSFTHAAAPLKGIWISMSTTAGPQMLWLPPGVDGVRFEDSVTTEGDWDVLPGGWKTLHRVTRGKGVQVSESLSRLTRETGGQVSLIFVAPTNQRKTSCLIGTVGGQDHVRLCLRAVEGGRGGVQP